MLRFLIGFACIILMNASCLPEASHDSASSSDGLTVSGLSPVSGSEAGGDTLTVTGQSFATGITLTLGGQNCTNVTVSSATELTCVTPAGSVGTVDLVAVLDGETATLSGAFSFISDEEPAPAPTVTAVNPDNGITEAAQNIVITGENFQTGATGRIGGIDCKSTTVDSATAITCATPDAGDGANTAGDYDVTVINPDLQSADLALAYNYRIAATYTELLAGSFSVGTCGSCHTGGNSSGGLRVDLYSNVVGFVTAGDPESSSVYNRLNGVGGALMPQGGPALSAAEIQDVYDWIWAGAQNN